MPSGQATLRIYDTSSETMKLQGTEKHDVVIDAKPFSKGGCRAAYFIRFDGGNGPKMVAKRYLREAGFATDYACTYKAHSVAQQFNQSNPPKQIKFLLPNRILTLNGVHYSIEEYLEGPWQKHNNIFGMMESCRSTPQAFSHFSWLASGQKWMVLDMQGVRDTFTDPAIVSTKEGQYGYTDTGMRGIRQFFKEHKCNEVCHRMGLSKQSASVSKSSVSSVSSVTSSSTLATPRNSAKFEAASSEVPADKRVEAADAAGKLWKLSFPERPSAIQIPADQLGGSPKVILTTPIVINAPTPFRVRTNTTPTTTTASVAAPICVRTTNATVIRPTTVPMSSSPTVTYLVTKPATSTNDILRISY